MNCIVGNEKEMVADVIISKDVSSAEDAESSKIEKGNFPSIAYIYCNSYVNIFEKITYLE